MNNPLRSLLLNNSVDKRLLQQRQLFVFNWFFKLDYDAVLFLRSLLLQLPNHIFVNKTKIRNVNLALRLFIDRFGEITQVYETLLRFLNLNNKGAPSPQHTRIYIFASSSVKRYVFAHSLFTDRLTDEFLNRFGIHFASPVAVGTAFSTAFGAQPPRLRNATHDFTVSSSYVKRIHLKRDMPLERINQDNYVGSIVVGCFSCCFGDFFTDFSTEGIAHAFSVFDFKLGFEFIFALFNLSWQFNADQKSGILVVLQLTNRTFSQVWRRIEASIAEVANLSFVNFFLHLLENLGSHVKATVRSQSFEQCNACLVFV